MTQPAVDTHRAIATAGAAQAARWLIAALSRAQDDLAHGHTPEVSVLEQAARFDHWAERLLILAELTGEDSATPPGEDHPGTALDDLDALCAAGGWEFRVWADSATNCAWDGWVVVADTHGRVIGGGRAAGQPTADMATTNAARRAIASLQ